MNDTIFVGWAQCQYQCVLVMLVCRAAYHMDERAGATDDDDDTTQHTTTPCCSAVLWCCFVVAWLLRCYTGFII